MFPLDVWGYFPNGRRMQPRSELIEHFAAYCAKHRIAESRFGRQAVGDGKFLARLRSGKGVTLTTIESALAFIEHNPSGLAAEREAA